MPCACNAGWMTTCTFAVLLPSRLGGLDSLHLVSCTITTMAVSSMFGGGGRSWCWVLLVVGDDDPPGYAAALALMDYGEDVTKCEDLQAILLKAILIAKIVVFCLPSVPQLTDAFYAHFVFYLPVDYWCTLLVREDRYLFCFFSTSCSLCIILALYYGACILYAILVRVTCAECTSASSFYTVLFTLLRWAF